MRYLYFLLTCAGIFALSNFGCSPKYEYEPGWYRSHLEDVPKMLLRVKDHLEDHRKSHGRYPSNDEGLRVVETGAPNLADEEVYRSRHVGWAIARGDEPFYRTGAGMLSAWFLPFVYENRRGLDPEMFAGSPVNEDEARAYSIEVDEGIYVWSVGGRTFAREYADLMREMILVKVGLLAVTVLFGVLFVVACVRRKRQLEREGRRARSLPAAIGSLVVVLTLLGGMTMRVTCYIMSYFGPWRRAKMIPEYTEILDRYREAGVIRQDTYDKLVTALKEDTKLLDQH